MWRSVASRFGLLPIQRILADASRRGAVEQFRALEVFGCTGERLTKHYAPLVRSVEVWEIDPSLEPALRRSVPTATVRITDSFAEIKTTPSRFDLVVVDNPVGCFGDGRCEHFDLFPDLGRVLSDDSMLVLLVCSGHDPITRARYPNLSKSRNSSGAARSTVSPTRGRYRSPGSQRTIGTDSKLSECQWNGMSSARSTSPTACCHGAWGSTSWR